MKRTIRKSNRSKKYNRSRRKRISRRRSRRNRRTSRRRTRKYRRSSRKNNRKRKYRSRRRKSMKGGVPILIPAVAAAGGLATIGQAGKRAHYKIKSLKQEVEDLKQRETALQQKVEQQEAALLEKEKKQRHATALPEEEVEEVEEVEQGEGTPIFGFNQILDELEKISEDNNYTSPLIYGIFQEFCDNEAKQVQYTELNKGLPKQFNFDDDLPPFLSDAIKSNLQRRYEVDDDDIEMFFAEFMKLFNERRGSRLYNYFSPERKRKKSSLEILLNTYQVKDKTAPHDDMTVKDEPEPETPVHILPADQAPAYDLMSL